MKNLSRSSLPALAGNAQLSLPDKRLFSLPEKVLQFGTGVLLRGLPDYLIDQANRKGIFNGRIVAVKSTGAGDPAAFGRQNGLYTLCIRGVSEGREIKENVVCSAVSRVLSAKDDWDEVLEFAASPDLEIILSNTTEVGIQLVKEEVQQSPPASFPGKLLAVLYARYCAFHTNGHEWPLSGRRERRATGVVIVPTELLPDNGARLKSIVLELAHFNRLDPGFFDWLERSCTFCNSLVDRIVPGKPNPETLSRLQTELGYTDELLAMAEPYALWAIEGDDRVREVLSFYRADPKVTIIAPDIGLFRELKLRLLNGTHTLSCGLAHLAGLATVGEAMRDPAMANFIERLMLEEIAPAIPYPLPEGAAERFGRQVLDRFRNPFAEHKWLSITVQYSSKMKMRVVPVLIEHYRRGRGVPERIALGFAAMLAFLKPAQHEIQDDNIAYFFEKWETLTPEEPPRNVLSDKDFWGEDLAALPGFAERVTGFLAEGMKHRADTAFRSLLASPA
ncbi:MAG: tagaturonate reductase [Haliscomenobacteraceae bacterium CHB4]|nr:Altronate oxidoreductase [Saprospiraceae bacterium]MCE7922927.1 tagaturonate reductase [Haliscomenobacteraceae bacterium CHB4]